MNYGKAALMALALGILAPAAQAHTCGNQDKDNRPNHCFVKKDEVQVHQASSCKVVSPGKCVYTHCAGYTQTIEDPQCCCLESKECKGAEYVGICVGTSASKAPTDDLASRTQADPGEDLTGEKTGTKWLESLCFSGILVPAQGEP